MSKLGLYRDGVVLVLHVDGSGVIEDRGFQFRLEVENAIYARLLYRNLLDSISSAVEEARRDAYNAGWRDAKSKKVAKQTWFSGALL